MVKGKSLYLDGVYKFIQKYEAKYNIKFGVSEGQSLGNIDPRAKPHKLVWCERKATTSVTNIRRYAARGITPFDGVPYIFLGESFRRCIYGISKYIKYFHNKRRSLPKTSKRFCCRSGIFCGCPGIVVIREVYKFMEMKIPKNCSKLRFSKGRQFVRRWSEDSIDGQRWFYFFISPLREHENHEAPGTGGCTVEPYTEDKLAIIDKNGEVIDFELHDPQNPSADPPDSEESVPLSKRPRLEQGEHPHPHLQHGKSQAAPSSGGTVSLTAPLSYEDSLLNHEPKSSFISTSSTAPVPLAVSASIIQSSTTSSSKSNSVPVFNAVAYRAIAQKSTPVTSKPTEQNQPTLLPIALPMTAKQTSGNPTAVAIAPARVVPLKKESPKLVQIVNPATNNQLKHEISQFQKRTDTRLSAVEHRMSSIESRMASLESTMLQISAQIQTIHNLLVAIHPSRNSTAPDSRNVPTTSSNHSGANLTSEPVIPSELDFACISHDDVHLEPFSLSSCDVSPK